MRTPTLIALSFCGCLLHAQWTTNTSLNTLVRAGATITAATPLMADGPAGSTYISWFDNQLGGYELRMQRLDADGNAMWDTEGLVVSDHPQNSALFRYDLDTDHDGNAIVAFQDERSGQLDIVAYKIDPNGSPLWGADGVALTATGSTQGLGPSIGVLTTNDVVIAWNANNGSSKWVAIQHVLEDGSVPEPSPMTISGANGYSRPKVIPTSDNGFCVQYVKEVGNFPYTCTMHAKRFDSSGTQLLQLVVSTKTISVFFFPEPVADGHDGFYLAFNTSNPASSSLTDVYVQRVRGDFSEWSAAGTEALTGNTTQRYGGKLALLNDDMGLMLPVQVTNTGQSMGGWNIQRLDTAGVAQLGASGVEIVPQSAALASPDGIASTWNGCLVVYSEGGFGQEHLRATRLGTAGNTIWAPALLDLCTANSNKDDAACGAVMNDQLVTVWQDDRTGSGIYAQNISVDGILGPMGVQEAALPSDLSAIIYRTDGAVLRLDKRVPADARINVLDAAGRSVWTARSGGQREITLPGDLVNDGMYIVRVMWANEMHALRWVRL